MFMLCLIPFITAIPYFWLLFTPFYASICGMDLVLRLSLSMYGYVLFSEVCNKFLGSFLSFPNLFIFIVLIANPYTFAPDFLVYLYKLLLLASEPVLMICEAILLIDLCCRMSQHAVDQIDDHPIFIKGVILSTSFVAYILSARIFFSTLLSSSTLMISITWILLVFHLIIFVYVALLNDEGVISDAAIVCLMSFGSLFLMKGDLYRSSSISIPENSMKRPSDKSFLLELLDMPSLSYDEASKPIIFLTNLFNYKFWIVAIMRIFAVTSVIKQLLSSLVNPQEYSMDEEDEEESFSRFLSRSAILKIAAIFVYTQLICSYITPNPAWSSKQEVTISRLSQSFFIGGYYLLGVYHSSSHSLDSF